eukprot:gene587-1246_t
MEMNSATERVIINVRNTRYETLSTTLNRYPETLLGSVARRATFHDSWRNEIILDRNTTAFEAILFYYQSNGILAKPCNVTMDDFAKECEYFGIDKDRIDAMKFREGFVQTIPPPYKQESESVSFKERVWMFLEYPETSVCANIYSALHFFLVIASNIILLEMTVNDEKHSLQKINTFRGILKNNLQLADFIIQLLSAIDFLIRIAFTPRKSALLYSLIFWFDLLAIFPYLITASSFTNKSTRLHCLDVFNTARVLRIFRWYRENRTLYIVFNILRRCSEGLIMLVHSILAVCILFGGVGYYAELGWTNTQLTSLPQSMWWAIQTMTCLGYGDVVPVTIAGKIAGSCVAIIGTITLTVPLVSIGGRYMSMYTTVFSMNVGRDMKTNVNRTSNDNIQRRRTNRNFLLTT